MSRVPLSLLAVVAACGAASAFPVLANTLKAGGLTVFRDHAQSGLYYYAPGKLVLKAAADGSPEASYLILRYQGSAVSGDSGAIRWHSYLDFKVGWEAQGPKILAAQAELRKTNPAAQLIALPIQSSACTVVFTPLEGGAARTISGGTLVEDGKASTEGAFFEKSILLCPDEVSGEALWGILKAGGTPLAMNCELKALAYDQAPVKPEDGGSIPEPTLKTVTADGVSVSLDATKYPYRLVRTELGASAPKEYAILQVLCFDFESELRRDLFSRSVELEATSVTGKVLRRTVRFRADNAAACVATFRFDAAVSLKQPYRYRIRSLSKSGKETVGTWKAGKLWPIALDITSPPEERPKFTPRSSS